MSRRGLGRSSAALRWLVVAALATAGCGGLTDQTPLPGGPGGPGGSDNLQLSVQPDSLALAIGTIGQLTASARTVKGPITPLFR